MPNPHEMPPGSLHAPAGATAGFLGRLEREVMTAFSRLSGLTVVTFPFDWPSGRGQGPSPLGPRHPQCGDVHGTLQCLESWDENIASLRRRAEVHWHQCPFGQWCAAVPVAFRGRCIAVGKLVGYGELSEAEFAAWVDHLDVLIQDFVRREAAWLAKLIGEPEPVEPIRPECAACLAVPVARPPEDSLLGRVLKHIHDNLSRCDLTVKKIAETFERDAAYLGHAFRRQVGMRPSWFIWALRMERAQDLLGSTRWPVKRVALAVGYSNPEAFSQAFRVSSGLSPTEFRRRRAGRTGQSSL